MFAVLSIPEYDGRSTQILRISGVQVIFESKAHTVDFRSQDVLHVCATSTKELLLIRRHMPFTENDFIARQIHNTMYRTIMVGHIIISSECVAISSEPSGCTEVLQVGTRRSPVKGEMTMYVWTSRERTR